METTNQKLDPEFKAKWIAELRSGKYKQGKRSVCRKLGDGTNEYCCLGVGYVVAKGKNPIDTSSGYLYGSGLDVVGVPPLLLGTGGWGGTREEQSLRLKIALMNDNENKSFSEIADWIEANL